VIPIESGVDLNESLPLKMSLTIEPLVEVIEHVENQTQRIREIGRVLKESGVAMVSTPDALNVFLV
jgi:SAM-dependent methyltransferase